MKNPISLLQEVMIKKKSMVHYEFLNSVEDHTDSDKPFTCKVQCNGLSAIGRGYRKKEAKHNAAKALLEILQITSDNDKEWDELVPNDENYENAIGALWVITKTIWREYSPINS